MKDVIYVHHRGGVSTACESLRVLQAELSRLGECPPYSTLANNLRDKGFYIWGDSGHNIHTFLRADVMPKKTRVEKKGD